MSMGKLVSAAAVAAGMAFPFATGAHDLAPACPLADCARIFESEIRDGVIHGATVIAGGLEGKDTVASWGWADAAHTAPMTPRTVVDMASVTKTAAGVTAYLVAHARGKVADFDVPFTNYLPAYTAPIRRTVTLRDLANHVSGFGEADDGRRGRVYFSKDPQTMLKNILSMPPKAPKPGHVFYSCRNYVLLFPLLCVQTENPLPYGKVNDRKEKPC